MAEIAWGGGGGVEGGVFDWGSCLVKGEMLRFVGFGGVVSSRGSRFFFSNKGFTVC